MAAEPDLNTEATPSAMVVFARGWARTLLGLALVGGVLFLFAGDFGWGSGWLFLGVLLVGRTINTAVLSRVNPRLGAERSGMETPGRTWDQVIISLMGLLVFAVLAVAGMDARFGWLSDLPRWSDAAAVGMVVLGDAVFLWALVVNRYFSRFVKVEPALGQRVVSEGPYRWVRHPGYLGWLCVWLGLVTLLDSPLALALAVLAVPLVAVRIVLEERALVAELEGYVDYMQRVRYRLLPALW